MKTRIPMGVRAFLAACAFFLLVFLPAAQADDFEDYGTPAGRFNEIDLPEVTAGWFDAIDYFPDCAVTLANNPAFGLKGRMLLANNKYIFIQKNYNSAGYTWGADPGQTPPPAPQAADGFQPVAYVAYTMDPTAIKISPDGTKVALIPGAGGGLYVFPSAILNTAAPVDLDNHPQVTRFTGFGYGAYDMEWVSAVPEKGIEGNRYLAVNEGVWPGPPYGSGIYITDLTALTYTPVIGPITGASASVTVDRFGNIYAGNGMRWGTSSLKTGEIRVIKVDNWWSAYQGSATIPYDSQPLVAEGILSAAQLGFDLDYGDTGDHPGNLHVGGGDLFGPDVPPYDIGYAGIVRHDVVHGILSGSRGPVNESSPQEFKKLAPDPLQDDSAQSPVTVNPWSRQLVVAWNPSDNDQGSQIPGTDEFIDFWLTGVIPRLAIYSPQNAPDTDGDDIPDGSDNAYLTFNPGQQDTDGDGYGNATDADLNSDGKVDQSDLLLFRQRFNTADPNADMNSDGVVNQQDLLMFRQRFNNSVPYY